MSERNPTGSRRHRRGLVTIVAALVLAGQPLVSAAPAGAATCDLVPQLRDVTINQGLGSYPRLARGKETLVKVFLSLPSCAPRGATIARTGGTLRVTNGTTSLGTVSTATPAPAPTYPTLVPHATAPALNAPGDATFVVPGPVLKPSTTTGAFTAQFTVTLTYSAKTSSNATPVTGSVTFTNRPGTTTAISALVEKKTNALRVLVVPMGDPTKLFSSQFSDVARAATQKGMATVSRLFPVPSGTSGLAGTGGLRYTINPALLDVSKLLNGGKFCGGTGNFDALKGPLAQMLLSWNTANPTKPADRVMGVVDAAISNGASSGCAEGMAAVGGTQSWVRAIADTSTTPSMTGALMAMELGHTLGLVPKDRSDFYSPHHSANTQADVTAPDRAYNVSLRSYVNDDRTAMTMSGTWNDKSVLFERDDYLAVLCALGGAPGGGCTTSGAVGTAQGVGADPTFVISGTTDGGASGTSVVNSYFAAGAPRTEPATSTAYQLVQRGPDGILRSDRVSVVTSGSEHSHDDLAISSRGLFAAAVPFDTGATRIELVHDGAVLYARDRTAPPVSSGTTVTDSFAGGPTTERVSVSSDEAQAQVNGVEGFSSPISGDARYVVFTSGVDDLVPGDANGTSDVFLRDRVAGTTTRVSVDILGGDANGGSGITENSVSDDGRYVAFTSVASDLVPGDANDVSDTFVRDVVTGTTTRVSVDASGGDANFGSFGSVHISGDGRYVAFPSHGTDLVAGDTNGVEDAFRRDLVTGTTIRLSTSTAGVQGDSHSSPTSLSADGRYAVLYSNASDLAPGDGNGIHDLFLKDVSSGVTTRVSVDAAGGDANQISFRGRVSDDGRLVAFASNASDLVVGDANAARDVFLRNISTTTTTRLSVDSAGADANALSDFPAITGDGRFVAFESGASNIVAGDGNGTPDVFLSDVTSNTTERVSLDTGGGDPNSSSFRPSVSDDGRYVSFSSSASDLVAGDTNGVADVFVRDRIGEPAVPGDEVATAGTDDNPDDTRADLFLDCGDESYPVAVGLTPDTATLTDVSFSYQFDPAVACAGGTLTALLNDGFSTSAPSLGQPIPDDPGDRSPLPAITAPTPGTELLAYSQITLRGSAKDPEDGELTDGALVWSLDGTVVGTGSVVDLSAPEGGWTPGEHTATLEVTDSAGNTASESVSFTILADADNDGVPAHLEIGCVGSSDTDAEDAYFGDADGDGIPNADDVSTEGGPCTAASAYQATVDVKPDFIDTGSTSAPVSARVTVPFRDLLAVEPTSVRIRRIEGLDVADDPRFVATAWSVTDGVATATFDRSAVNDFLRSEGIVNRKATFTIGGASTDGTWSFEGADQVSTK